MKAIYSSNYLRKEGEQKGKTFHIYTIKGTVEELKAYMSTPQFKKYPRKSPTGEPQMHTMYMDALRDELPLYKKQDGNYTLDQSETRKDTARLEMLEQSSSVLASAFGELTLVPPDACLQEHLTTVERLERGDARTDITGDTNDDSVIEVAKGEAGDDTESKAAVAEEAAEALKAALPPDAKELSPEKGLANDELENEKPPLATVGKKTAGLDELAEEVTLL